MNSTNLKDIEDMAKLMITYNISSLSCEGISIVIGPQKKQAELSKPETPIVDRPVFEDPDFYAHLPSYMTFNEETK